MFTLVARLFTAFLAGFIVYLAYVIGTELFLAAQPEDPTIQNMWYILGIAALAFMAAAVVGAIIYIRKR